MWLHLVYLYSIHNVSLPSITSIPQLLIIASHPGEKVQIKKKQKCEICFMKQVINAGIGSTR